MSFLDKIKVGVTTKKYAHDMSFDNNTTAGFGFAQPLGCQFLSSGDDISFSARQLLRLAPMPFPTFGRIKVINVCKFVNISDVWPCWDAFVSSKPYNGSNKNYVPTTIPYITNIHLVLWLMHFSECTIYSKISDGVLSVPKLNLVEDKDHIVTDFFNFIREKFPSDKGMFFVDDVDLFLNTAHFNDGIDVDITPDSSDFCIKCNNQTALGFGNDVFFCFRLNGKGRKILSVLRGLGYSCDFEDSLKVSLLPLLSYYKAWFDLYSPQTGLDTWSNTRCFKFIQRVTSFGDVDFLFKNNQTRSDFKLFIHSLSDCFYYSSDDFVSIHTEHGVRTKSDVGYVGVDNTDPMRGNQPDNVVSVTGNGYPYISSSKDITSQSVQVLLKLASFVNKDSVLGGKIQDWLRANGYENVSSDIFRPSDTVSSFITNCDITDVISTADTAVGNNGEFLGAYAGKGIGFNDGSNSSVKYHAETSGYFVIISSIVPVSRYYQGTDPSYYKLERFDIPNTQFDALGYELTPRGGIYDSRGMFFGKDGYSEHSFGFVPRLSSWKYHKDIVNGDLELGSTRGNLQGFHLERVVSPFSYSFSPDKSGSNRLNYHVSKNSVPDGGTTWRSVGQYPFLSGFNRIFYNSGNDMESNSWSVDLYDNFIMQTVFRITVYNKLKPLDESFDTFDKLDEQSSREVSTR